MRHSLRTMRMALLLLLMLCSTACEVQEHHDEPDPAVRAAVDRAARRWVAASYQSGETGPPERWLQLQIGRLTAHAMDADHARALLAAEQLDDAALRSLGATLVDRLRDIRGIELPEQHLLRDLLGADELADDDALLTVALLRQLAIEEKLPVAQAEHELLGLPRGQARLRSSLRSQ